MSATPVERVVQALEAQGLKVRRLGYGVAAQCPAHNDRSPSLSVTEGADGRALLHCHAGCSFEAVLAALELAPSDAFVAEERHSARWQVPSSMSIEDAEALWDQMASRDDGGERYLAGRGLLVDPLPSAVVRFNRGGTGSSFVDYASEKGFRIAFAVRNARGEVSSISFRHIGGGAEWSGETKTKLALKGRPVSGAAIVRPEVTFLLQNDPEFLRDEVILCEGGTDWLAATIANDLGAIENDVPPAWVIGCVGASNAASVVKAFAPVIAGRALRLWFDNDEAGRTAAALAASIAIDIGVRRVHRYTPDSKDVANQLQRAMQP